MAFGNGASDLLRPRRIQEDVEHLLIFSQEEWCAPANDDRVPFPGDAIGDFLHHRHHAVGIEDLAAQHGTPLVTAAPERFGETMEWTVDALIAALHRGGRDIGDAGNFFGEEMIPELPTEAVGQFCGDAAGAASVLAFNGDDAKHSLYSEPCRLLPKTRAQRCSRKASSDASGNPHTC